MGILNFNRFLHLTLMVLLVSLILVAGYILLFIPGIYLTIALCFSTYVFVFRDQDGVMAIKQSYKLVSGRWWYVFGFSIFVGFIFISGFLLFVFGALITAPLAIIMIFNMFETLDRISTEEDKPQSIPQVEST